MFGRVDYYSKTNDYYVRFFRNIALNTPGPWSGKPDGVYGIDADGKPLTYEEASAASSLSGVAIVMYGRALQISNSQLGNKQWGSPSVNISGLTDISQTGGGVTSNYGYLPKPDGSYGSTNESYKIKEGYANWPNYPSTALADTAGWSNTEALIAAQGSSYLGGTTTTFRNNSTVNQGHSDWFVPAEGQLAYMYLNHDKINTLLAKCSNPAGTALPAGMHWSSSESNTTYAWDVDFVKGSADNFGSKGYNGYVRFCRDITE